VTVDFIEVEKDFYTIEVYREAAAALCEQFNRVCPVGTPVLLIKDLGEVVETKVKFSAGLTVNGPMVGLECTAGGWQLSRVIPIPQPAV